jgi:hypothetical protein
VPWLATAAWLLSRVPGGVEPENLQVFGELTEDVPCFPFDAAGAAEQVLKGGKHGTGATLGLALVRKGGAMPYMAEKIGQVRSLHRAIVALVLEPELLSPTGSWAATSADSFGVIRSRSS